MERITPINPQAAEGRAKELQRRIGELEAQLAQREAHDPRPSPA